MKEKSLPSLVKNFHHFKCRSFYVSRMYVIVFTNMGSLVVVNSISYQSRRVFEKNKGKANQEEKFQ